MPPIFIFPTANSLLLTFNSYMHSSSSSYISSLTILKGPLSYLSSQEHVILWAAPSFLDTLLASETPHPLGFSFLPFLFQLFSNPHWVIKYGCSLGLCQSSSSNLPSWGVSPISKVSITIFLQMIPTITPLFQTSFLRFRLAYPLYLRYLHLDGSQAFKLNMTNICINIYIHTYIYVCVCVFFWLHCAACRILVPWLGIKPLPSAVEVQNLNHWTARKVPQHDYYVGAKVTVVLHCIWYWNMFLNKCGYVIHFNSHFLIYDFC